MTEVFHKYGILFSSDELDEMNDAYELKNDTTEYIHAEDLIRLDGTAYWDCVGHMYRPLSDTPWEEYKPCGFALNQIPYIYIIPTEKYPSLFASAYKNEDEIWNELGKKVSVLKERLPDDFNLRDHFVEIYAYSNHIYKW